MVKNKKVNLDKLIKETLEEKMNQYSTPPLSSTKAWEKLQMQRGEKPQSLKRTPIKNKVWLSAASVFLLLIGSIVFTPLNGSAFTRWTDIFYNIQGSVVQLFGKVGEGETTKDAPTAGEFYVVEDSEFISEQMSLTEARKVTSFPIVIPENIPGNYHLDQVTVVRNKNETSKEIYLNYSSENSGFTITQMIVSEQFGFGATVDQDDTKVEEVQINGKSANLLTFKNGVTKLVWVTNSHYFSIEGKLNKDEIIQTAKSM